MWLRIVVRGRAVRDFHLPVGRCVLGRGASCDVRIEDRAMSRRHAELERQGGVVTVCDLGSRNGLYVNDQRARGRVRLAPGDVLTAGSYSFELSSPLRSQRSATASSSGTTFSTVTASRASS